MNAVANTNAEIVWHDLVVPTGEKDHHGHMRVRKQKYYEAQLWGDSGVTDHWNLGRVLRAYAWVRHYECKDQWHSAVYDYTGEKMCEVFVTTKDQAVAWVNVTLRLL
jgi:hypothetical protein